MNRVVNTNWGSVEIDAETGMPVLPEGYFWRVRADRDSSGYIDVQIRRKFWIFSRAVVSTCSSKKNVKSGETILADAAYLVRNKFKTPTEPKPWEHFLGDYPPKKLKR